MNKTLAIAGLVLVLIVGAFYFFRSNPVVGSILQLVGIQPPEIVYWHGTNPNKVLHGYNTDYTAGDNQLKLGNATSAIEYFTKALQTADDKAQSDQIKFKIAAAKTVQGKIIAAINDYKVIANDTIATPFVRAYAMEDLWTLWYMKGKVAEDEIFKDEPFKSIYTPNDPALTRRKLAELSTAIFSLPVSELRVADWYAAQLNDSFRTGNKKPVLTDAQKTEYQTTLEQRLAAAEKDIEKRKDDPNNAGRILTAYTMQATIERTLVMRGLSTREKADALFKKTAQAYAAVAGAPKDALFRFQYARYYLDVYKGEKISEVQALMAPLYTDKRYLETGQLEFFRNERTNRMGRKNNIIAIANVDPNFKSLLVSLGWKDSDFTGS